MDSRDERRRVFLRRRAAAAACVLGFVVLISVLAAGGGDSNRSPRAAGGAAEPGPARARSPRPTAIDRALLYTDWIKSGSPHRRELALTFDDGPSAYTPKLVKALRRRHAAATFFPVGYAINEYGRYLKLLQRSGFAIGDHTMNHPLLARLSADRQAQEIDGQARLVRQAGVPYPRLFRPPYGSFGDATRALLHERRMLMVLWSVNPEDYYRPGTKVIVARVLAAVRPGAIVLMHDGGGDRSQTVAAVPALIRKLRARGYRLVTVPRLVHDDPPPRHQGEPPNLAGI